MSMFRCYVMAAIVWLLCYFVYGVNISTIVQDLNAPLKVAHLYYLIFALLLTAPIIIKDKE